MASSEVAICNMALIEMGDALITSLTDDSDRARACNTVYADARDQVLYDFPWAFSVKRAKLAKLAAAPAWGFGAQFQLPTDVIRVLNSDDEITPWRREADTIVTDRSDMAIRYIARITDPTKFSAGFTKALVAYLKFSLPITITGSLAKRVQFEAEYQRALRMSRGSDEEFAGLEQYAEAREQSKDIESPLSDVR